jgi:hypothetical protein
VANAVLGFVLPDGGLDVADADFADGFVLFFHIVSPFLVMANP